MTGIEPLKEHLYDFLGHQITVRSNSEEILSHLQSVYERFYRGNGAVFCRHREKDEGPGAVIRIEDHLDALGEIHVEDGIEQYRLKCKNFHSFDYDYYRFRWTVPDPITLIQWLVLRDACIVAKEYFILHAGAVAWNGKAYIFPADSGLGKTTLTLALVKAGFRFLSDEVACLKVEQGTVEPFVRKLNLSEKSRQLVGIPRWSDAKSRRLENGELEWRVDIEEAFPSSVSSGCGLGCIIFLQGFGEKPRLDPVSNASALFRLFPLTFAPTKNRPGELLIELAPLVDRVQCFNLIAGDVNETADVIRRFAESEDRS